MEFLGLIKMRLEFCKNCCLDLVSSSNFYLCGWSCHLIFHEVYNNQLYNQIIKYGIAGIVLLYVC